MVTTRSGKVLVNTAVRSKGFNVRGRAADALPTNVFVSHHREKLGLALAHQVKIVDRKVTLADAYDVEQRLNQGLGATYVLIGHGADWLYYGKVPLEMRGPRPAAKAGRADPKFPAPPGVDLLRVMAVFNGPATLGDSSKSRDSIMGDSARNYAASVYGEAWAHARTWEWLHIRAHSLGGDNAVGNLVAGTFDANTKMIPYEAGIQELSQSATPANPFHVMWEVDLYPDSWVAIGIKMRIRHRDASGELVIQTADFNAQTDMNLDKLQFDLLSMP